MKNIFKIVLLFSVTSVLPAFNYDNYRPMTLEHIYNAFLENLEFLEDHIEPKNPNTGIMYIFNQNVGIPISVSSYPNSSETEQYLNEVQRINQVFGIPEGFIGDISKIPYNDITIVLIWQNPLADAFRQDVALGQNVGIYLTEILVNTGTREMVYLVNAFNTQEDYDRRSTVPLWHTEQ